MAPKIMYVDSGGSDTAPYETWAKAATNIQTIIDYGSLEAGDTIYCKGTIQAGAAIDFDGTPGTWALPIKFIGVNTGTTAEPPIAADMGTNRYSIDANSGNYAAAHFDGAMDYLWFVNFEFKNSGNSHGILNNTGYTNHMLFVNCRFTNNNQWGIYANALLNYVEFKQCMIDTNGAGGFYRPGITTSFVACRISDNTGHGIDTAKAVYLVGCIFTGNTVAALRNYAGTVLVGVVVDTNATAGADGILTFGALDALYLGVRVTNINDIEISNQAGAKVFMDYIYTDGTITEGVMAWRVPDKTMTAHITESGGDTGDGYESGELNLDPDTATYFSEGIVVPSS